MQQDTAWYERAADRHPAGRIRVRPDLSSIARASLCRVAARGAVRASPSNTSAPTWQPTPFGDYFVNRLNNGQTGDRDDRFSDLDEDLFSGGVDVSYAVHVRASRRPSAAPSRHRARPARGATSCSTRRPRSRAAVAMFRPDLLLQPGVIDFFDIGLIETTEATRPFLAELENYAGYAAGHTGRAHGDARSSTSASASRRGKQDGCADPGVQHAGRLRPPRRPRQRLLAARGDADLGVRPRHAVPRSTCLEDASPGRSSAS